MELEIDELSSALEKGQRLLGFDLGSKTIGIALSDVMLIVATPMETIPVSYTHLTLPTIYSV